MNLSVIDRMNSTQLHALHDTLQEMPQSEDRDTMLEHITSRLKLLTERPVELVIEFDTDVPNPLGPEDGLGWKIVSFGRSHSNFEDPEKEGYFVRDKGTGALQNSPELQTKLDNGTAFILSYFEHGNCIWFRRGSKHLPDMCWDGVGVAGILLAPDDWVPYVPEGEKPTSREEIVDSILEEYTNWCNGNVYGYEILNDECDTLDSCWGFIGDHLKEHLQSEHPELWDGDELVPHVVLSGEAKDLLS